jgi:hypothetical protein
MLKLKRKWIWNFFKKILKKTKKKKQRISQVFDK